MNKFVGTCYGIAKVLSGTLEFGGHKFINLKLTENSWFPGKKLLAYPVELIEELEDHD